MASKPTSFAIIETTFSETSEVKASPKERFPYINKKSKIKSENKTKKNRVQKLSLYILIFDFFYKVNILTQERVYKQETIQKNEFFLLLLYKDLVILPHVFILNIDLILDPVIQLQDQSPSLNCHVTL